MGVDLRLLPYDCDRGAFAYSHTILSCDRDRDLFALIADVEKQHGRVVVSDFTSFVSREGKQCEEPHYGTTTSTPYGDALKEVEVDVLLPLVDRIHSSHFTSRAIWAYLKALPSRTRVALYWH